MFKKGNNIQKQETIEITAHDKKLAFSVLNNTIMALEEYVEKVGYPDFKKQVFDKSINSPDRSPEDLAEDFLIQLYCLKAMVNKKPSFLRDEVKEKFYKWIDATGINVKNCSDKLKNYLFEINEILEGGGERFVKQMENKLDNSKATPADALKVFSAFQNPINKNKEQRELLKGKTHKDVKIESKFDDANDEKGKEVFGQIADAVAGKHDDFNYYQKNQQIQNPNYNSLIDDPSEEFISSSSQTESSSQELDEFQQARRFLIDDIKQHANEFELKPVLTFNGHRYDAINKRWTRYGKEKQETILVHKSAQITESDYNEFGYLSIQNDKMFQENRFSQEEWVEIQESLNNAHQKETDYQAQTKKDNHPKGGGKGGYGSSIMYGSFSVISLIGLAFTKK